MNSAEFFLVEGLDDDRVKYELFLSAPSSLHENHSNSLIAPTVAL